MVAGVNLDLVAGEVAQIGDDSGLLRGHSDHCLGAFKGLLILVRDVCAHRRARGGCEESVRPVGDAHHGASLS